MPLDRNFLEFNSLRVIAQKAGYLRNGTGDQPQTWTKVSSNGVLLINNAIAIFAKKSHTEGFPRFGHIYHAL